MVIYICCKVEFINGCYYTDTAIDCFTVEKYAANFTKSMTMDYGNDSVAFYYESIDGIVYE